MKMMVGSSPRPRDALIVALVCGAEFMVVLDASIVNVALPAIRTDLAIDDTLLPWVVNSYLLPFAALLLIGGRLGDRFGLWRVFAAGSALFTAASLAAGLAGTPGMLIAGRVAQGVGAAVLIPTTLAILTAHFPDGPRRARAIAMWSAIGIAGGAAGNVLGGVLTSWTSWRWIFLINGPLGIAAILLAFRRAQPRASRATDGPPDWQGAALAAIGLAALTWAISDDARASIVAGAVGVVLLAAFVHRQRRTSRPLIPPSLFLDRGFAIGNAAMLLAGACLMPMWYFLSLTMQDRLGLSPIRTGLGFLPHAAVTAFVGAALAPQLMNRLSNRLLVGTGALVAAAGFLIQSAVEADSGYVAGILLPGVVISAGAGLLNTPLTAAILSRVPPVDAGVASGVLNTTKQVGAALGLAAIAALIAIGPGTADYGAAFAIMAALMVAVALSAVRLEPRRP